MTVLGFVKTDNCRPSTLCSEKTEGDPIATMAPCTVTL